MKTGRIYLAIFFMGAFAAISVPQSAHGFNSEMLAQTMGQLSECDEVKSYDFYEDAIQVQQICSYYDKNHVVGEYKRTLYIDYYLQTSWIEDGWMELLD